MPYDPGVSFQGGDYLYRALSQAGQSIGAGISDYEKKHAEIQQKLQESGVLHDYGSQHGYFTPEEEVKYAAASANEKANMTDALAKTIALGQADREGQLQRENAIKVAQIAAASRGGNEAPLSPEAFGQAQQAAWQAGYQAVPTKGGGVQYLPFQGGGADEASADPTTFKAQQVQGTGTSQQNPAQYITTYADAEGKRHIAKNAMIQGVPKAQDPYIAAIVANMFPGGVPGMAGGGAQPTFNVTQPTPASPAAAATAVPETPGVSAAPIVGEVRRGYRFKGGNPADPNSWEQAQ